MFITRHAKLLIGFSLLLNVVLVGWLIFDRVSRVNNVPQPTQLRLVKPIQPVSDQSATGSGVLHYHDLKPQVAAMLASHSAESNVGFFLQNLSTGAWLGFNEQKGFFPASLLKVPIMLAIMKQVDRQEIQLTDHIKLINKDLDRTAGNLHQRGASAQLSYWELIKIMIQSSDNTAKNALKRQLSEAELNAVFAHVGIPNPYQLGQDQTVSARSYGRVLKSLYFSTFLSPELSEKSLDIMTDTETEVLLPAKIPAEIQVAHKYSETAGQVGDCGIIYHPRSPYILCIIVEGLEPVTEVNLLVNLSKLVFDFVDQH